MAAREWRKVIAHCEDQLQKALKGNLCSPEPMQTAGGALAIARAWLADLENRRDDLRIELPNVIVFYERRVWRYQRLLELKAISEEEAEGVLKDLGKELHYIRGRLAAVGGDFVVQQTTGKVDKR